MKQYIKTFLNFGVLLILSSMAISACAEPATHENQLTNTPATVLSTPTAGSETAAAEDLQPDPATSPAVGITAEVHATPAGPITKQEVIVMWNSVDNFTSVIDRLDGLTDDEKQTLIGYITQEIELNDEVQKNCTASLTAEERAALKDMDMGSPLYQQASQKFNDALINVPACSEPFQELEALMSQNGDLLMKVKQLVYPYMNP
jgi:hypothetical protein